PLPEEINACNDYLDRQIAAIDPQVIVTLGRYSMVKFFGNEKISAIHGRARKIDGRICIAMYHPAAGLHQASLKDVIRQDFKKIPLVIAEAQRIANEAQVSLRSLLQRKTNNLRSSYRCFSLHGFGRGVISDAPTWQPKGRMSHFYFSRYSMSLF